MGARRVLEKRVRRKIIRFGTELIMYYVNRRTLGVLSRRRSAKRNQSSLAGSRLDTT